MAKIFWLKNSQAIKLIKIDIMKNNVSKAKIRH